MTITIESTIHFQRREKGRRKRIAEGTERKPQVAGRVPRVSRLMALAIRFERLIEVGEVRDFAELARLAHVSRARITQIMNLLLLAMNDPQVVERLRQIVEASRRRKSSEQGYGESN